MKRPATLVEWCPNVPEVYGIFFFFFLTLLAKPSKTMPLSLPLIVPPPTDLPNTEHPKTKPTRLHLVSLPCSGIHRYKTTLPQPLRRPAGGSILQLCVLFYGCAMHITRILQLRTKEQSCAIVFECILHLVLLLTQQESPVSLRSSPRGFQYLPLRNRPPVRRGTG